ncbi:RICIN domain-containing protein [Kitasatospora sp. NPDC088351]|uniref:RICIN domain-containing protein n=1 Tax=unclassified Kitasatospora TaxID=2633591 RepID=UPI003428F6FB
MFQSIGDGQGDGGSQGLAGGSGFQISGTEILFRATPPKGDEDNQQWKLEQSGAGTYKVRSLTKDGCMSRSSDTAGNARLAFQQNCADPSTDWIFDRVKGERYRIHPAQHPQETLETPLDLSGEVTFSPITVSGDRQQWYVTPVAFPHGAMPADGDRTLDQMTFLTTHNSFNNTPDTNGHAWFVANQNQSIANQLQGGVRALMLDAHYNNGKVRMCHETCMGDDGGKPMSYVLTDIANFLKAPGNENEIVTAFVEDYTTAEQMRAEVGGQLGAGGQLDGLVFDPLDDNPTDGKPGFEVRAKGWPTLSALRSSGKRLILFSDRDDKTDLFPDDPSRNVGFMFQKDWTVENYWTIGGPVGNSDWTCKSRWNEIPLAKEEKGFRRLFVMNHFRDAPLFDTAAKADNEKVLNRAERFCTPAARKKPNYLAVDMYELGNPLSAVQALNQYTYQGDTPGYGGTPNEVVSNKPVADAPGGSLNAAYSYLQGVLDAHVDSARPLGVPRSYTGGHFDDTGDFPDGYQTSFTYDNAVVIAALLQGSRRDPERAIRLGDSLLYAQQHDPATANEVMTRTDGRIRASYLPDPFITTLGRDYPVGTPYIGGWSVYTGNMAWAGMAFCHLYRATGDNKYLDGALKAAEWIQANAYDGGGIPGYTGGYADTSENGTAMVKKTWKATEHNIDVGALFGMLADITGVQKWRDGSNTAFAFVKSMQADDGRLWTGTGNDGASINQDTIPADVQIWSYLATLSPDFSRSVDWAAQNIKATDGIFTGIGFANPNSYRPDLVQLYSSKVWFEGTAHLLAAYHARSAPGDGDKAAILQKTLEDAQTSAPNNDGHAIVAASSDGLETGQGDLYYASRHTGATAWYLLAGSGANPFRL